MRELIYKQHYELMGDFERIYSRRCLDRKDRIMWGRNQIYQDEEVNDLFLAFRAGYILAEVVAQQEE